MRVRKKGTGGQENKVLVGKDELVGSRIKRYILLHAFYNIVTKFPDPLETLSGYENPKSTILLAAS